MRKRYFDRSNHRLVYLEGRANEQFWDEKWEATAKATFANPPRHGATVRTTRQYLPPGSRVLEGGCGLGDVVHALHEAGYAVEGVDYAPKVVQAINASWPHLTVIEGDVRQLPCVDGFYDGYWSFGVIEHFTEGYEAIACEMHRVLRPGGYLFLSFPSFNTFRKSRALAGKYPVLPQDPALMKDFYQFALDPLQVQANFERIGFELVEHRGVCSLIGLAEDWPIAAAAQNFFDHTVPRAGTAVSLLMDRAVGRYAGHSCLLILRRGGAAGSRP